jgi:multiple sugar transport system permease protein
LAAPAGAGLLLLLVYPTVTLLGLAVTESSLARPLQEFTGWDNAVAAWEALAFRGSLVRSTVFAVVGAAVQVVLGVALALLLRARGRGLGLAGTLLLLPLVTPPVMVGVAWKLMLAPVGGALTGVWDALGIGGFNPLGSGTGAFLTLLVIDTWQWLPFVTLLVFAALLGVPDELLEAAQLDGAGWWRSFAAVVWPVITPTVLAVALIKTVIGFKVFDLVVVVTEGGPGLATVLAPFEIYRTALRGDFDVGVAAVQTLVFAALVGVVTAVLTVLRSRAVRDEA